MKALIYASIVVFAIHADAVAQKMNVKVTQQQDSQSGYSYTVPAHYSSTTNENVNCSASSNSANCNGHSTTNGYATGERNISYSVAGATLSLLLPDGRLAVVNCQSKYKLKMDYINRRSCRIPPVADIQVDFKGDKAKLEWPVSLDGKKMESETYKIVTVLPAQP